MNYYTNPPPAFLPSWRSARVPGWGTNPAIVGPRMLGVGATPNIGLAFQRASDPCLWNCTVQKACLTGTSVNPTVCLNNENSLASKGCVCPPLDAKLTGGEDTTGGAAKPFPWIYVGAGVLVLGAGVLFAYKKGLFGKKG